jgi:hypothetical protein
LSLSRKDLESIICIACGKRYGEHTKGNGTKFNLPSLMTCMFRIQGTVVADGINDAPASSLNNEPVPPVEELEYDC